MGRIGSEHDPYYVDTQRVPNRPEVTGVEGEEAVHLELWKSGGPAGLHSAVHYAYLPMLGDEAEHDAQVVRVAQEMIARAVGSRASTPS